MFAVARCIMEAHRTNRMLRMERKKVVDRNMVWTALDSGSFLFSLSPRDGQRSLFVFILAIVCSVGLWREKKKRQHTHTMKTPARSHLVLPRQMDTFGEKRLFRNGRSKQAKRMETMVWMWMVWEMKKFTQSNWAYEASNHNPCFHAQPSCRTARVFGEPQQPWQESKDCGK